MDPDPIKLDPYPIRIVLILASWIRTLSEPIASWIRTIKMVLDTSQPHTDPNNLVPALYCCFTYNSDCHSSFEVISGVCPSGSGSYQFQI